MGVVDLVIVFRAPVFPKLGLFALDLVLLVALHRYAESVPFIAALRSDRLGDGRLRWPPQLSSAGSV